MLKNISIKREAVEFDQSLLECELTSTETTARYFSESASSSFSNLKETDNQISLIFAAPTATLKDLRNKTWDKNRRYFPHTKGYYLTFYLIFKNGFE